MTDATRAPRRTRQDGKTILWLVLGLLLLAGALAYYFNSGGLRVAISKDQILERLNEKLPLQKTYLYVFKVTYDSPRVELIDTSKRINAGLDIALEITLLGDAEPLRGRIDASAGVRYVPGEGAFYLEDPAVERLEMDGLPEELAQRAHAVLAEGLASYFASQPIYRLTERQSHRATKAVLQDVIIEADRVVLQLGPAEDNVGLLPTSAANQ